MNAKECMEVLEEIFRRIRQTDTGSFLFKEQIDKELTTLSFAISAIQENERLRFTLQECLTQIKNDNEEKAEQHAIRASLGISEWEALMPSAYHLAKQALSSKGE